MNDTSDDDAASPDAATTGRAGDGSTGIAGDGSTETTADTSTETIADTSTEATAGSGGNATAATADNARPAPPSVDLDAIERDLAAVEAALARLAEGTYRTDEVTGQPLSDDLLATDPTARHA